MLVKISELTAKISAAIGKLGYTGEDATAIFNTLVYAELRGNNQGIVKIATGGVPSADKVEEFRVVKQSKCGALVSGGHAMATTQKAAAMAVELAQVHGVGIVCSNHTFSSSGAIGYFARSMAKKGYIGVVCVGNGAFSFVAPAGSHEARFGTNPIAYSFPHEGGEVVFDNATAAMAFFGLIEAKLRGETVPDGIGYDKLGRPTIDPAEILEGSLATFATHKGYGLSLLVQILGGAFCEAGAPGVNEEDGAGIFILAIDPDLVAKPGEFKKRATELVKRVQTAKPFPGGKVYLPGEKGDSRAEQAMKSGEIEIGDKVWEELCGYVSN